MSAVPNICYKSKLTNVTQVLGRQNTSDLKWYDCQEPKWETHFFPNMCIDKMQRSELSGYMRRSISVTWPQKQVNLAL